MTAAADALKLVLVAALGVLAAFCGCGAQWDSKAKSTLTQIDRQASAAWTAASPALAAMCKRHIATCAAAKDAKCEPLQKCKDLRRKIGTAVAALHLGIAHALALIEEAAHHKDGFKRQRALGAVLKLAAAVSDVAALYKKAGLPWPK